MVTALIAAETTRMHLIKRDDSSSSRRTYWGVSKSRGKSGVVEVMCTVQGTLIRSLLALRVHEHALVCRSNLQIVSTTLFDDKMCDLGIK
jgi:hypothetical protein